jgi:DNA invertase Pin-like site-specific DNA recombinase
VARRLANRTRRGSTREVPASPPRRPCVVYARVSSKEQEREAFSIPAHQRLLNSYVDDQRFQVVKEFVDVETAKRAGCTNFTKVLAWLKKNRTTCRTILVEKTDRRYRNLKDWVVVDELDLEIHLVKEGIVLSDEARSTDKFMHGIRVLTAKNYIDNLSEAATKGMRKKASQGIGPSSAPLEYVNVLRDDGKRVIEPDPSASPMIHQLFEWAATGDYALKVRTKRVAEAGLLSRRAKKPLAKSVVHHLLRNPNSMGEFEWAGEHPAAPQPDVRRQARRPDRRRHVLTQRPPVAGRPARPPPRDEQARRRQAVLPGGGAAHPLARPEGPRAVRAGHPRGEARTPKTLTFELVLGRRKAHHRVAETVRLSCRIPGPRKRRPRPRR